jgi:hypothetical protein
MKAVIRLTLIVCFALTGCEKGDIYPLTDNYRLVKILNYGSTSDSEPNTFVDLEYDNNGNLIKESMYDYPNTLFTYKEYDYENNLLKKKRIYQGQVGNLYLGTYRVYEYENSKLIKEELFLSNGTSKYTKHYEFSGDNLVNTYKFNDKLGIHHQYKYEYNSDNLVILEETYMYNQLRGGFTKYYYDDKLRLTKTEIFNYDETIRQTEEHKYIGNSASPAELLIYDSQGELTQQRELLYDDFGNQTEMRIIDEQGSHSLFKKTYNGNLLIEHIRYAPNFGYSEWTVTRYEYSKIK